VPFPEPELAREVERVLSRGAQELICRQRHRRGVKDATGGVDERDDEDELEWVNDVVANLRGGDVQAEDKSYREAEDGGAADDGVDANEEASGDAPGQLLRRCSHAKQCEDGQSDAAVDPVVVNRRVALSGGVAI